MTCEVCSAWCTRRVTRYGDGSEIENWKAADGKGLCRALAFETTRDFECNKFSAGAAEVDVARKDGAPWQNFTMIPCPDCGGKGDGSRSHRCAGTGLVRLYDDGYIGDEQTRAHPNEKPGPPTCLGCGKPITGKFCSECGRAVAAVAETEVVGLNLHQS